MLQLKALKEEIVFRGRANWFLVDLMRLAFLKPLHFIGIQIQKPQKVNVWLRSMKQAKAFFYILEIK